MNHHPDDRCERRRCPECLRKYRHEHDCGVNVCPRCKSIDISRRKDSAEYECFSCGLMTSTPLRMEIKARLAMGA